MSQASAVQMPASDGHGGRSTDLFDTAASYEVPELHLRREPRSGLRAVVAIHTIRGGQAAGGCRLQPYADTNAAIEDALRLAQGMSYKAALAGLPVGGGKAVIMLPATAFDRRALFEAFGDFVEALGGRYATAVDSGTSTADMDIVAGRTAHVLGASAGLGGTGDPSPFTARGVRLCIEAAVRHRLHRNDLDGVHVAIQGCGHVGYALARELHEQGASLTVADIDPALARRCAKAFDANLSDPGEILGTACDVFAPCALGAVVNDATIAAFRTRIIAGAANNQLESERHGLLLHQRGILYVPDFVINAGGLIHVVLCDAQQRETTLLAMVERLRQLLARATQSGSPPYQQAIAMARELLSEPIPADSIAQPA